MVGRGEPGRCERVGGRAGRGHTVSSEPDANSLGACGHAHHGRGRLSTWQSQSPGARGSEAGALWHAWLGCRQRAREGPRELAGGGPRGRRDCGEGPGPPLPPPALPACPPGALDEKARAGGVPRALSRLGAQLLPVESGGGAPSPDTYPFSSFGNLSLSYPRVGQATLGSRDRVPGSLLATCRRPPRRGTASEPGRPPGRKVWGWAPWPRAAP